MLSYQHAYHAGNHADILKHFVLQFVINSLNKKEKPYTLYDTHAGSGLYDLMDNRSIKTKEAENGILSLFQMGDFPPAMSEYISLVKPYIQKKMYPGSPELESVLKRPEDKLNLSELHPQEFENLKNAMKNKKNVQIHNRNGFEMLKALTPPETKRGAILIDPSYEQLQDYTDVANTIINVHKKWSNGIIMLWYPLLAHRKEEIQNMLNQITAAAKKQNKNIEIVDAQLLVNSENSHKEVSLNQLDESNPPRLYGSGMLVLNAPWHLKESTDEAILFLSEKLNNSFN